MAGGGRLAKRVTGEMGGGGVKVWSEVIALAKNEGVVDLGQVQDQFYCSVRLKYRSPHLEAKNAPCPGLPRYFVIANRSIKSICGNSRRFDAKVESIFADRWHLGVDVRHRWVLRTAVLDQTGLNISGVRYDFRNRSTVRCMHGILRSGR